MRLIRRVPDIPQQLEEEHFVQARRSTYKEP
jgi:hypothetical protein